MLDNRDELLGVLGDDPRRIGKVFARHAYGMRRWVDLFSIRVPLTGDPEAKQLLAEIVAANARHMNLFRARALAHGVDPDAYVAPPEGEAIYERIEVIDDFDELVAYARGLAGPLRPAAGHVRRRAPPARTRRRSPSSPPTTTARAIGSTR